MAYAAVEQVKIGFRDLSPDEEAICAALLEEAAVLIDAYNAAAGYEAKQVVSCRMVRRAIGNGENAGGIPIGASQGSMSALGYSQSWQMSAGTSGELYIGKTERKLLGLGDRLGAASPLEGMVNGLV